MSLFKGVSEGISGVITQPYKEIKSKGAGGLFMGVAKGFSGLFTKPVSGMLDTISKTAEVRPA